MKPERRQNELDRVEWRIGLQAWELRMPRWIPELPVFESPGLSLFMAACAAVVALGGALASPLLGPPACAWTGLWLAVAAACLVFGVFPRYARVRGPELVLGLGPSHLEIGADWPYVPADRLTAALAGLGWEESRGRRIPWAELLGARLSEDRTHLELMQADRRVLRLPVAGSRRWDRTLAAIARELDEHCRRVHTGAPPAELDALRTRR